MGSRRGAFIFWKGSGNRLQTRRRPPFVCTRAASPPHFLSRAPAPPPRFLSRACARAPVAEEVRRVPGGRKAGGAFGGRPTQGRCTTCLRRSFLDGWREWSVNSRLRKIRILEKGGFLGYHRLDRVSSRGKMSRRSEISQKRRGSAKRDAFGRQSIHFQFERNKGE